MLESIPYTYLLTAHVGAFTWSVIGILAADSQAVRWLLGWTSTLSGSYLTFWHRWVWVGLVVSLVSGFSMFWPLRDYLLGDPTFLFKVSLVLVLILNALFIGSHMRVATTQPFRALPVGEKRTLVVSGAVSTVCWMSIAVLGVLLPL